MFEIILRDEIFKKFYARNLCRNVLNNLPKLHGDRMNGVMMHIGQTDIYLYFVVIYVDNSFY